LFKHLLIPTDGSALAAKGVRAGVKLARALGARVSGVYVIQPYIAPIYADAAPYVPGTVFADYEKAAKAHAKRALALIEREAAKAGVRGASRVVEEMQPWQGILKAARKGKCDAIVMASHGRGGLGGVILGSQTARVLAHSKLPVLVIR
jgi:nucleotide-binding universal stress UspA family protein